MSPEKQEKLDKTPRQYEIEQMIYERYAQILLERRLRPTAVAYYAPITK
jgi:hypothetical protein